MNGIQYHVGMKIGFGGIKSQRDQRSDKCQCKKRNKAQISDEALALRQFSPANEEAILLDRNRR